MFIEKLKGAIDRNRSFLCIGLDSDRQKLPHSLDDDDDPVFTFNCRIIDATKDLVCAYKPNLAFYEAYGAMGLRSLKRTLEYIPPDIPIIIDAKRSDIGNSSKMYARSVFEEMGGDGVTVTPYMGFDSVEPFAAYHDRGVFVLCLTSNPGADDFQKQMVGSRPMYEFVASEVRAWWEKGYKNLGLVAGATRAEELGRIRELCPELPLLIPGVGSQGGKLNDVLQMTMTTSSIPVIINASRSVIFASSGEDFDQAARRSAERLRDFMKPFALGKE